MGQKRINGIFIATVFIAASILFMIAIPSITGKTAPTLSSSVDSGLTVIIDAGHGGQDGGAVGVEGIIEKDINLAIALKIKTMLEINGVDVILTRDSDMSIHDDGLSSTREIKVSDLHNRMAIMEEFPDAIFISIHQNKYEQSSSSGAQVFYGTNHPESAVLAEALQKTIREAVQPDNNREIKPTTDSIYLLEETKSIAVMVECGFLSNPGDAELLVTDEYQNQLAFGIYAGLVRYLVQE